MPLIMNTTNETQKVRAFGNFFEFKPKQIKPMQEHIADFIASERSYQGMVALPESFEDLEYRQSDEGKAQLKELERQGIESYLGHLRSIIYNNQVSLRQDLEQSGIKADPASFASEGELEAMRLVASYQSKKDDEAQKRIDEVKELVKKVGPITK